MCRVFVGAPSDGQSGSVYFCPQSTSSCEKIPFDIYRSADFSYNGLGDELFGYSLSTLPLERSQKAVVRGFEKCSSLPLTGHSRCYPLRFIKACSPRLSYEVTGNLFVTGGCFSFSNQLTDVDFLGASTCLDIPESSRSLDLRYCLNGASASYFHDSENDLIVSGSPYYKFARGNDDIL